MNYTQLDSGNKIEGQIRECNAQLFEINQLMDTYINHNWFVLKVVNNQSINIPKELILELLQKSKNTYEQKLEQLEKDFDSL